jgi:hypothetical protein
MIGIPFTPALIYVDPSSTSLLMQILAPIFILLSVLGSRFKKHIVAAYRRIVPWKTGMNE